MVVLNCVKMVESPITSTPDLVRLRKSIGGSSGNSSLRRRSLLLQTRVPGSRDQEHNDDDAERISLVAWERAAATSTPSSIAVATSTPSSTHTGRSTLNSSPQKEHYQGCLKLYAENKITKDNAWNLQLIDFMTSMLRRHDARMDNLQTASTVVDASARIYSFRVDAVHHDVLKMAGGLVKAAQAKRGKKDDDAADPAAADGEPAPTRKKKKRSKGAVAANVEGLNGDFDANDCIDPFFERLSATTGDVTSSNRAYNATLPVHDKTLALILRTDERFLEPFKENIPEIIDLSQRIALATKLLPAYTAADHICEPFNGFSISNWDPDTEDNNDNRISNWVEEHRLNLSQQALAFDVNAEVEPIPLDEAPCNDLLDDEPLAGIDSDEEADVALAACVARLPPAAIARVTDMRPAADGDTRLEYSYSAHIVTAWAGPTHWRLKNNRASSKLTERSQPTGTRVTESKKLRARRQLDFTHAGLASDSRAAPSAEYEPALPAKIMISRKTLATGHTWNEANFKTPVDRGLDDTYFSELYLRRKVFMRRHNTLPAAGAAAGAVAGVTAGAAGAEPVAVDGPADYDYDNENDASYCPASAPEGEEWGNDEAAAATDLHEARAAGEGLGDMLEPPTKVAKIFIPYAMRAKQVDMKQLKHQTWHMLTEKTPRGEKELVTPTSFFTVYKRLPSKLSHSMRDGISVPLVLLSVLHLANEKGLVLEKGEDLRDFNIVGLIN